MRCIQASYKALKEQIAKESVSEAEVREAEAKLEAEQRLFTWEADQGRVLLRLQPTTVELRENPG